MVGRRCAPDTTLRKTGPVVEVGVVCVGRQCSVAELRRMRNRCTQWIAPTVRRGGRPTALRWLPLRRLVAVPACTLGKMVSRACMVARSPRSGETGVTTEDLGNDLKRLSTPGA